MSDSETVGLNRLVLSFADALDELLGGSPDHQQRVAYIATAVLKKLGADPDMLTRAFLGATLHDVGHVHSVGADTVGRSTPADPSTCAELGYLLMADHPLLAEAAKVVRYSHVEWSGGQGRQYRGGDVPQASHAIFLADIIERNIECDQPILNQKRLIRKQVKMLSGQRFDPECAGAFLAVSQTDAFWLDCVSPRIYSILLRQCDWPWLSLDGPATCDLARSLGAIVDGTSRWTVAHSVGVAAVTDILAAHMEFSPDDRTDLQTAAHLHDVGKLAIPRSILNKPGALTEDQRDVVRAHPYHTLRFLDSVGAPQDLVRCAALHHERLDGEGYPYCLTAEQIPVGARVLAAADTFSALLEDRPYRSGYTPEAAMEMVGDMTRQGALDATVVGTLAANRDQAVEAHTHQADSCRQGHHRLETLCAEALLN